MLFRGLGGRERGEGEGKEKAENKKRRERRDCATVPTCA